MKTINVEHPIRTVKFNPLTPELVAAGTFNGEVLIFDIEDNFRLKQKLVDSSIISGDKILQV